MQYSFTCPACGQKLTVDAASDEEAVNKLMAEGANHQSQAHAGQPAMPEDQARGMVESQMKKGEEGQGDQPVAGAPEGGQPTGEAPEPAQPVASGEQPVSEGAGMPAADTQTNEEGGEEGKDQPA